MTKEEFVEMANREKWGEEYIKGILESAEEFEAQFGLPYTYEKVLAPLMEATTVYYDRSVRMD